jgi:hypothetical protein
MVFGPRQGMPQAEIRGCDTMLETGIWRAGGAAGLRPWTYPEGPQPSLPRGRHRVNSE